MKASELVRKGWCQGTAAVDKDDRPISCDDDKAVKFCALGAIHAVWLDSEMGRKLFKALVKLIGTECVADWNDLKTQTQEEVVRTLEQAEKEIGL